MIGWPASRHLVHVQLEVGELRLTEDRALDVLEIVAEQREPRVRILHRVEHVTDEQILVERRGDLGDENRIVRQRIRLRLVREVALHRVAHLVGDRAHVACTGR